MRIKYFFLLVAFSFCTRAFSAITVTITDPTQYSAFTDSIEVTVSVNGTVKYNLPYIAAKIMNESTNLTYTSGNNFTGKLKNLQNLPWVDTLTLVAVAVGFNKDTAYDSIKIIHLINPYVRRLYSPINYIAVPQLRIIATGKAYKGPCNLQIINPKNNAVMATGIDSIDVVINCPNPGGTGAGYLYMVGTDTTGRKSPKLDINYYYEQDHHYTPVFVADGPLVGTIVDFNYNRVLIRPTSTADSTYRIVDLSTLAVTSFRRYGREYQDPVYPRLTKNGAVYRYYDKNNKLYTIEYNNGNYYDRRSWDMAYGSDYIYTSNIIWDIPNMKYDTVPLPAGYSIYEINEGKTMVVRNRADSQFYYYSPAKGLKAFSPPFKGISSYFVLTGSTIFVDRDSIVPGSRPDTHDYWKSIDAFEGTTTRRIAGPIKNINREVCVFAAREGFLGFYWSNDDIWITDTLGNAQLIRVNEISYDHHRYHIERVGGDGNITYIQEFPTLKRYYANKNGDTVLIATTRGKTYYYNGSWYITDGNVLYKITTNNVLALNQLDFTGQNKGKINQLNWQTTGEKNMAYFQVQRSSDGRTFTPLGIVNVTGNNSAQTYSFADNHPLNNTNYYRLKIVDNNGKFDYSKIISINSNSINFGVTLLPNPVHNSLILQINTTMAQKVHVELFSVSGKLLTEKQFNVSAGASNQPLDMHTLPAGMYMAKVTGSNKVKPVVLTIVKQ
ncbi:MAG TPA: T9SS type A sorting domain-containing protein [Chitinophagaceae bacterium]|nr:T9SS type A sorting domain-containing protein [Chitinophagaceae bacterium]